MQEIRFRELDDDEISITSVLYVDDDEEEEEEEEGVDNEKDGESGGVDDERDNEDDEDGLDNEEASDGDHAVSKTKRKRGHSDSVLARVSDALTDVEPPGDFFTNGVREVYPPPGVVVDGLGDLPLPLNEASAKALVSHCHLAPYGHKEKTMVDTQVRNTWELSANQFRIDNPKWQPFIDDIVESCRLPMGIPSNMLVAAKLYKMLLYEVGGKFDRHQDSEKEVGMFGTLVVVLPCRFEGGALLVHSPSTAGSCRRDDDGTEVSEPVDPTLTRVWDTSNMDALAVKYAAFYGDCPHEIKPVTSGYRLCLTYNLVTVGEVTGAPHFGMNAARYGVLKDGLCAYFSKPGKSTEQEGSKRQRVGGDGEHKMLATSCDITDPSRFRPTKLVYMLDHKYTQHGLSFKYLKNKDALVASSLLQFCKDSKGVFELCLSKVVFEHVWHGAGGAFGCHRHPRSDEWVEVKLKFRSPWILSETDAITKTRHMCTSDVKCDLDTEVTPHRFFNNLTTFDSRHDAEFTGNEGARSEKWYKSAALILLPVAERVAYESCSEGGSLLRSWLPLVEVSPVIATDALATMALYASNKLTAGEEADAILDGVAKLHNLQAVKHLLIGFWSVASMPKLQDLLCGFDWNDVVLMLQEVVRSWEERDWNTRVDVRSLFVTCLKDVQDRVRIATLFDTLKPICPGRYTNGLSAETIKTERAMCEQVVKIVALAPGEHMDKLFKKLQCAEIVHVVSPTVRELFERCDIDASPVQSLVRLLDAKLPETRISTRPRLSFQCPTDDYWCKRCRHLSKFFEDADQMSLDVDKLSDHELQGLKSLIDREKIKLHDHESSKAVTITKMDSKFYLNVVKELELLKSLVPAQCEDKPATTIQTT